MQHSQLVGLAVHQLAYRLHIVDKDEELVSKILTSISPLNLEDSLLIACFTSSSLLLRPC